MNIYFMIRRVPSKPFNRLLGVPDYARISATLQGVQQLIQVLGPIDGFGHPGVPGASGQPGRSVR